MDSKDVPLMLTLNACGDTLFKNFKIWIVFELGDELISPKAVKALPPNKTTHATVCISMNNRAQMINSPITVRQALDIPRKVSI